MATSFAQRAFHWPKSNINRASLDKSLPSKPPREGSEHGHGPIRKPDTTTMNPTTETTTAPPPRPAPTMTTVLIGPQKQRFKVNKKLLCAASPFFRERLEDPQHRTISLWLPGELPSMFALFVDWLHTPRHGFRRHLEDVVAAAASADRAPRGLHDIHWALIRLHLFASHLSLYHLQDSAMDALQDLYLNCDWDIPPGLLTYLYTRCDALPAVRLRRWAVAMVAFSLTGSASSSSSPVKLHPEYDWGVGGSDDDGTAAADDSANRFRELIDEIPDLSDDYTVHLSKMAASGLDLRFKNPQLRIPANKLRNDERSFGFRECSFHSHRATVGERRCPHERKRLRSLAASGIKETGDDGRRLLVSELVGSAVGEQLEGLTSPSRRPSRRENDAMPRPLFADGAEGDEKGLKHVRSISSTLK